MARAALALTFRPAGAADADQLVALYDRHYAGGYSACFDRYGRAAPQDVWWVQSEKSVTVVEVNRRPAGLIILGWSGRRLLAEEVLLDAVAETAGQDRDAPLRQVHDWLTRRFQEEGQDRLTLRCAEMNAPALSLARSFAFAFANALLVASLPAVEGTGSGGPVTEGYRLRPATAADAKHVARLHEEAFGRSLDARDLDGLWRQRDARVVLAERQTFPVGFLIARVRGGAGRWTVGVREGHRRRGLGRALAAAAAAFFRSQDVPAVATYWGTDTAAAAFVRRLGARVERTYLYLERAL